MASVSTDARGNRRILFVDTDGRRKTVYLGPLQMKAVAAIKVRIEHLVAAKLSGCSWDSETGQFIAKLSDDLSEKLAAVGLVPHRNRSSLGDFVKAYIDARAFDAQPSTICNLRQAERLLNEFFKNGKRLRDVTPGDADDFRRWVATKIGDNTARRMLGRAKQFFRAAQRKRLIVENPFGDMRGLSVQANRDREFFIDTETAAKVLAACPDTAWRLLFALARYGRLASLWR